MKHLNLSKSRYLLLMLFALLIGASPTWAQKALPYSYGFEDNNLATDGWTALNPSNLNGSEFGIFDSSPRTGTYKFQFSSYNDQGNTEQYLITPELNAPTGVVVSFYHCASSSTEYINVGYSTSTADVENFTWTYENLSVSSSYNIFEETFPAGTKYIAIKYARNYKYRVYVDDFSFKAPPTCITPTDLTTADITSSSVKLSWTSDADAWNVQYKKAAETDWTDVSGNLTSKSYTISGLQPATAYQARVRTYCDASDQSDWTEAVSFTTLQEAVSANSFSDDFEGATNWLFVNGDLTNAWTIGSATNNGGSNAMYISNDGGTTSAYTTISTTTVYASKLFTFSAGKYDISYDWKGYGESTYDYMRVAIVPASTTLTAGTSVPSGFSSSALPTGWIAIDGGSKLNLKTDWQTQSVEATIETAGDYMVVFAWRNDNSSGTQPAAAIDNFSIDFQACPKPTGIAISDVKANEATLGWDNVDGTTWEVYVSTESAKPAADVSVTGTANVNTYQFTSLTAETTYYAWVRAVKGSDKSDWVGGISFTTTPSCITPTAFAASNVTLNSAILTWTDNTEQTAWEVSYSTTSGAPDNGTIVAVTEKSYELTGLTAGTTYYASVRAVNSDTDKSAWSTEISFTPGMLTVNEGTTTNNNVPVYGNQVDNLSKCQFIIPATSLADIANKQLDKIVFYSSTASIDWGNATFDVYLKEVENTSFTSSAFEDWEGDGMEKVYSGKLSVTNNKMEIVFANPFDYEGGNLLIGINQTAKGSYTQSPWYGVTTSSYVAYGGYGTSSSNYSRRQFLPKTSIYYSPIVVAPRMVVDETPIAFGLVEANSTQTATFTIRNKGKAALNGITVTCTGDAFSTTEVNNASIAVDGEAITVTVTFDTTTSGDHNGTITVNATDQEPATIEVSGTVKDPNKIFIDFSESNPMPATWSMASGWSVSNEMAYNNGTAANIISGEVVVADGGENIFFDYKGANAWGETYDYVKVYYATTGNGTDADWTLIDNATFGCTDATTWKQAKVTIPANAKYICLQGKYIYIDNFYGLSLPMTPYMVFTASDYSFGMIDAATTTEAYTIQNTGKATLTGLSVTSDNENFTVAVADNATSIAAGGQATFTVTMMAEVKGTQSGVITVAADGFDATTFNVSGYVVDDSKIYATFDDNQLPAGWSDNTGWTFADGKAVSGTDTQMTLPALTVAEGEKMAISVEATGSNPELYYYTSTDGGTTWSAMSSNLASAVTTTAYSVVYIDGLAAGNYKLKLQGYHIQIDAINGFTLNTEAPELTVSPTTAAAFGTVKAQPDAKTYTITNSGTGTLTGTIASDNEAFTVSESAFSLGASESMTFDIALVFDENYGGKSATITVSPANAGLSPVTIAATATTKDPNVWEEDFENGSIPATWITNGWTVSNSNYGNNGTYMAYAGTSSDNTLITPRLEATEGQKLTFEVGGADSSDPLYMQYSSDRNTWSEAVSYTSTGNQTFTAPADGYYYLKFYGRYASVDNFYGFKEAPLAHDAVIASASIPATGNQYVEYTATVTVTELAGKSEELTAKFYIGDTQYGESVVKSVAANGTETFTVTFTPDAAISGDAKFVVSNSDLTLTSATQAVTVAAAIVLAETEAPELTDGTAASVVVNYTAKAGWNTICMPFALTSDDMTAIFGDGWTAYEFKSYTNGELGFITTTTFYAGYPYIVYSATPTNTQLRKQNVSIDASANNDEYSDATFQGTYAPMAAGSMEGKWGVTSDGHIMEGTESAWMKGFRAYFELPDGSNGARLAFFDETTGITRVIGAEELDEGVYNLNGQKVDKVNRKGLYIIGGKKVVRK